MKLLTTHINKRETIKIYQRSSYMRERKTDFRLSSLVQVKYIVLRFWSLLHNCFTDSL